MDVDPRATGKVAGQAEMVQGTAPFIDPSPSNPSMRPWSRSADSRPGHQSTNLSRLSPGGSRIAAEECRPPRTSATFCVSCEVDRPHGLDLSTDDARNTRAPDPLGLLVIEVLTRSFFPWSGQNVSGKAKAEAVGRAGETPFEISWRPSSAPSQLFWDRERAGATCW